MSIIDEANGIFDYEANNVSVGQGKKETSLLEQDFADARKALFDFVEVVDDGKTCRIRVLEAIVEAWTRAAALGDANAIEQLDKLSEHQQRQLDRAQMANAYRSSPIRTLEDALKPMQSLVNNIASIIAIRMMPCFVQAYGAAYGPIQISSSLFPYYLDPGPTFKAIASTRRRMRKTQPKGDYIVGKGKTSVATRFTKDRNPRRKTQVYNAFASLDASRNRPVMVTTAKGKKVKTTRRAVSYANLFREATRGKRRARVKTCKIIISLDKKGMLSPPDTARRRRRGGSVQLGVQHQMFMKAAQAMMAPAIKRDLIGIFECRYGKIPPFETLYERRLTPLEEIDGWAQYKAERSARDKPADKTSGENAAQNARVGPVLAIPTCRRTRATQVSFSAQSKAASPAASPSKLPLANKPVVRKVSRAGKSKEEL